MNMINVIKTEFPLTIYLANIVLYDILPIQHNVCLKCIIYNILKIFCAV